MRNKLQRGGLNLGPLAKLGSGTMLNDQLSLKFKLVGFEFNVNIMPLTTLKEALLSVQYASIQKETPR